MAAASQGAGTPGRGWRKEVASCLRAVDQVLADDPPASFLVVLIDALQTLRTTDRRRPMTIGAAMAAGEPGAGAAAEIAAAAGAAGEPGPQTDLVRRDLEAAMSAPPAVVRTAHGPLSSADLVRLLTVRACTEALSAGAEPSRPVLIAASRVLAAILGERHGGRTIEMRVPPATAVQLEAFGQGPNHHRGTPPNVAETDPATFVRLATGILRWADARRAGLIQASGSHVDAMARMLPVTP